MRQEKLGKISQKYRQRWKRLLHCGQVVRCTKLGYWAPSNVGHVFELFKRIRLERFQSLVDLGSGDGVVVAVASLFTRATGIEIDEKLHGEAVAIRDNLGLDYHLKNENYLEEDLSEYDFMFMYPDKPLDKLEKKIVGAWKGTLVVVDHTLRPSTIARQTEVRVWGIGFGVYEVGTDEPLEPGHQAD